MSNSDGDGATNSIFDVSQLYALLRWYMIGVSKIVLLLIQGITDVPITYSPALTSGQEVKMFTPSSSSSRIKNGFID